MTHAENKSFQPTERMDSPSYWLSRLLLSSWEQDIASLDRDVLASALSLTTPDVQSVCTAQHEEANLLEVGANLEADDPEEAMTKASGLALMAFKEVGVDLEDIILTDGRLVSGASLAGVRARKGCSNIYDDAYSVSARLDAIFTDIHAGMIKYDSLLAG